MIHLNEKLKVLERENELPDFTGSKELFLDFETLNCTEGLGKDFKRYSGLYPYKGDKIGSFAVTADDHMGEWQNPRNDCQIIATDGIAGCLPEQLGRCEVKLADDSLILRPKRIGA